MWSSLRIKQVRNNVISLAHNRLSTIKAGVPFINRPGFIKPKCQCHLSGVRSVFVARDSSPDSGYKGSNSRNI